MTRRQVLRSLTMLAAVAVLPATAGIGLALDQFGCTGCCHRCGRRTCTVTAEPGKEKKHCWCIERKDICIPAVRFPWMSCCEPRCGRVRTVRALKKKEYECDVCEYEWTIHELCPDCRAACGAGCGIVPATSECRPAPRSTSTVGPAQPPLPPAHPADPPRR